MNDTCPTCKGTGRLLRDERAPVQADRHHNKPAGTIAWWEHLEAWAVYAKRFGKGQSAERIAERCGFGYGELLEFLGHEPRTWEPWRDKS